jgi:hypothetical protein
MIEAFVVFLYYLTTPLILTSILFTFLIFEGDMSSAKIFTTLMISVIFEVTAQQLPQAITELVSVINSIHRMEQFLKAEEIDASRYVHS